VPGLAQLTERERVLHRALALGDVRIPVGIAFARLDSQAGPPNRDSEGKWRR
jgi:hypothetical protein